MGQAGRTDFDTLYSAFWPRIHGFCQRLCRNRADSDDLAQEVFLLAYQHLTDLRDPAAVRAWIYKIAVRHAGRFNARYHQPTVPLSDELMGGGDDPITREIDRTVLQEALQRLPEPLREAVILVKLEGLTSAEAGRILHVSEGTVRWRVHQGLREMHRFLASDAAATAGTAVNAAAGGRHSSDAM